MTVQEKAARAMRRNEVTKTSCGSGPPGKASVLILIRQGMADAMSVSNVVVMGETTIVDHYAVKFNDRKLGDEVRALTMEGFGL